MKLLLINQPLNNRGDESAHKAFVRTILSKIPNCTINVLFINSTPQIDINPFMIHDERIVYTNYQHKYKGAAFLMRNALKMNMFKIVMFHPDIKKIAKYYEDADIVVCCPGGICLGGFKDWNHMAMLYLAKIKKKKLIYFGRSFGPFDESNFLNKRFKKLSLKILNYMSFVSIRDKETEKIANLYNIKFTSTIDTAFLENPIADIPNDIKNEIGNEYVVFVPNSLTWHYNFRNVDINIIKSFYWSILQCLINHFDNCNIVMLPQTYNATNHNGDIIFFKELNIGMNSNKIKIIDDTYSSDIQQSIISKAKFLVGARYHSIVFAINNRIPFIALGYEHKISGLLESIDNTENLIIITDIFKTMDSVSDAINRFKLKLSANIATDISYKKAKYIVDNCFDKFTNFIENEGYC